MRCIPTLNDKTTIYLSSIDTKNDLATPNTVANLVTGRLRYDHNLNPRIFGICGRGLHEQCIAES